MGKGVQGLNDLLNQNFGFAKKLYRRAFAELEVIVEDDEEAIFLTNADYDDGSGIQTGLILISNSRIIYANRRKGDSALILKIMFEEVNDIYFDTGLMSGRLSLKGTLYEFLFQNMANADGKKISKYISQKVTANQDSKDRFSLVSNGEVDQTQSLLCEVFDVNKGWVFGASQIGVEMINEEKFKLSIMGLEIAVSEKVRVFKKQDNALKIRRLCLIMNSRILN